MLSCLWDVGSECNTSFDTIHYRTSINLLQQIRGQKIEKEIYFFVHLMCSTLYVIQRVHVCTEREGCTVSIKMSLCLAIIIEQKSVFGFDSKQC